MTLMIAPLFTAGITIGSLHPAFGGLQLQLSVEKTCEELVPTEPGTIEWTIRVENLGDEIELLVVSDPTLSELAGFDDPLGIEPNFGENDEFDLIITVDNLPAGPYPNTLTVTATDDQGDDTIFEVSAECEILPSSSIQVDIDIKPASDPNSINTKSMGKVPVAILGSETFDVTDVDVTTLAFGPAGATPAHDLTDPAVYASHLEDVNDDGLTDLVSHYVQKETGLLSSDTVACISGELLDATPIEGCDSVKVK